MNWNRNQGYSGQRGGGNWGGQRNNQQQGGNRQYKPNTAMLRPNMDKQRQQDPDFKGPGNVVDENGQQRTVFISAWLNNGPNGETLRLEITPANGPQQQRQGNGFQQQRPRSNGFQQQRNNSGWQGHQNGSGWQDDQGGYQHPQGGAMSRARPMGQPQQGNGNYTPHYDNAPQYDDSAPPHDSYPDGPGANGEDAPY